jgi:predicted O-methyltransferase YrrM
MTAEHNKAYENFKKYNEGLKGISINEEVEGGSEMHQCKYFIDYLIANPTIKNILEIGFNTGVSSAYFLSARDDIKVISVDIGVHRYVNECKKLIDEQFSGRHKLIIGDSKKIIPELNKLEPEFKPDLIFIDGDHIEPTPIIDARNCLALADNETVLVMDDTNLYNGWAGVLQAMCELVQKKEIDCSRVMCVHYGRGAWTLFWKAPKHE